MFDNLKFFVIGINGERHSTEFTAIGLLNFLCYTKLLTRSNAYGICHWISNAEPCQEYNCVATGGICFRIIALNH